ncbi:hypothetical protein ACLB2K_045798 [Fragaria x ananassa]
MELDWAVRIRTGPTGPILLTALNENAKFKLSAGQVQDVALDGLSQQMNDLSIKLESAEETIRTREKELEECRLEKEETD